MTALQVFRKKSIIKFLSQLFSEGNFSSKRRCFVTSTDGEVAEALRLLFPGTNHQNPTLQRVNTDARVVEAGSSLPEFRTSTSII